MTAADSAIYRDLMQFKPDGWTANAWAVQAGVSRTVWTDMRRHGNPSRRTLEKLLAAAGSSLAEFEALRIGESAPPVPGSGPALSDPSPQGWRPALSAPLPLVASSAAESFAFDGAWIGTTQLGFAHIVERLPRPPALAGDPDAYALAVADDAMWPRFRPGRRIAVSPRSPAVAGDDVVVTISADRAAGLSLVLVAELVHRAASHIALRQFNPDASYRLPASRALAIHKIVGELI